MSRVCFIVFTVIVLGTQMNVTADVVCRAFRVLGC